MNRLKKTVLTVITLSIVGLNCFSQEGETIVVSDFEVWTKAGVKLKLDKKLVIWIGATTKIRFEFYGS